MTKMTMAKNDKFAKHKFIKLVSYKNSEKTKAKCVASVEFLDRDIHNIVGTTVAQGKNGMHGCIAPSGEMQMQKEYGLPSWFANLVETLYVGVPHGKSTEFAKEVLEAIPIGGDLNGTYFRFCEEILRMVKTEHVRYADNADVLGALDSAIPLLFRMQNTGYSVEVAEWNDVYVQADNAYQNTQASRCTTFMNPKISAEAAKIARDAVGYRRFVESSHLVPAELAYKTVNMIASINAAEYRNIPRREIYAEIARKLIAILGAAKAI